MSLLGNQVGVAVQSNKPTNKTPPRLRCEIEEIDNGYLVVVYTNTGDCFERKYVPTLEDLTESLISVSAQLKLKG